MVPTPREFVTTCKPYQGRPGCGQKIIMMPTGKKPDGSPKYSALNEDRITPHYQTCAARQQQQQITQPETNPPYPRSSGNFMAGSSSNALVDSNRITILEQQVAELAQQVEQAHMKIDSLLVSKNTTTTAKES